MTPAYLRDPKKRDAQALSAARLAETFAKVRAKFQPPKPIPPPQPEQVKAVNRMLGERNDE